MIRLNSENNEKEKLLKLVKLAIDDTETELECIVGNTSSYNQNTREDFVNVLKRIKNKVPYLENTVRDRLDISIPNDSQYSKKITRVIINGTGAINTYCNNEKLSNILGNVDFEYKDLVRVGGSKSDKARVVLADYGIRVNLKKEQKIDKENSLIRDLINDWKDIKKSFRHKKIFSFYHQDGDFRIDLSIVNKNTGKESVDTILSNNLKHLVIKPSNVKEPFSVWWNSIINDRNYMVDIIGDYKFYKNLKESRVLETKEYSYEIEVEWLENRNPKLLLENKIENVKDKIAFYKKILIKFIQQVGIILQVVQDSLFLITKTEKSEVLEKIRKLSCFKNCRPPYYFPLAMDLEYKHISKLSLDQYSTNPEVNVRMDYLVTDKADGKRCILYISNNGRCYLLNRKENNLKIFYTGTVISDYANSVYDGEYITKTVSGEFVQWLYLFDAYMIKGKDITSLPFGLKKNLNGRHIHIINLDSYFHGSSNKVMMENSKYSLRIFNKVYYVGNETSKKIRKDTGIFEACNKILQKVAVKYGGLLETGHQYSYPIDGIIFQPLNLGVGQDRLDSETHSISGRWRANLKWKPSNHITIDFRVKLTKEIGSDRNKIVYYNNNKYVKVSLSVQLFNSHEVENLLAFKLLNEGDKLQLLPENYPFVPIHPYLGKRAIDGTLVNDITKTSNFILDNDGNLKTENGDIIDDNMIVECRFNKNAIDGYQWEPILVRSDKEKPNGIMTAFKIWELIVNPITTKTISGEDVYAVTDFQYKAGGEYISQSMNTFHNYVKGELINRALSNKIRPKVLDLACGKMGDMHKYASNTVDTLVGLDIMPEHLYDPKGGAAVRLLGIGSRRNRSLSYNIKKMAKKTMLILGNFTKNLASGEACSDELNRFYVDILYGRHRPEGKGKLQTMYNVGVNQFHLVVCNFAISYAFDNRDDFHQLLLNVRENLKDQGYFVITFLDGREVLKKLRSEDAIDGKISGYINKHLVWSIESANKEVELDLDESPYGQKILSYLETFMQPAEENLVDPTNLEEEALQYDLKLIDSKLFNEEPDSMYNQFERINSKEWESMNKEKVLKEWSSTHRWAIFQKVDGLTDEN